MAALMVTLKRVYTESDLPRLLLPVPPSRGEPLPTNTSTRDPPNTSKLFWFSLLGGHCFFPLSLGVFKVLFVPAKPGGSLFPSPVEVM